MKKFWLVLLSLYYSCDRLLYLASLILYHFITLSLPANDIIQLPCRSRRLSTLRFSQNPIQRSSLHDTRYKSHLQMVNPRHRPCWFHHFILRISSSPSVHRIRSPLYLLTNRSVGFLSTYVHQRHSHHRFTSRTCSWCSHVRYRDCWPENLIHRRLFTRG